MALINFSGIASGIDTEGLIAATSDATRRTRVQPLETKVTEITDQEEALTQLKEKFETLRDALREMGSLEGGAVVKQVTSSSESLITASAANGAVNGTYTVSLGTSAKASNGVQAIYDVGGNDWTSVSATFAAGATVSAEPSTTNNLSITVGGDTTDIDITSTTTIGEVVSAFNSDNTKGVMTAVNIGTTASPVYRLVVTSLSTGATEGAVSISVGSDFTGAVATETPQVATSAVFDLGGVATGITRSSNTVNDVISGVNFTIQGNPSAPADVTITVADDVTATTQKVQDFIDAWNDIVNFIKSKNTITRDESNAESPTNVFGVLRKTNVDNDALTAIRGALADAVYEQGSQVRIMPDLGIKTKQDGTLEFDTDDFEEAMAAEPNSVNELLKAFADDMSSTAGLIHQFTGFNKLFDVTINNGKERVTDLNRRIADIEGQIAKTEAAMRARFAALESSIGKLQSQQGALSNALAGLG